MLKINSILRAVLEDVRSGSNRTTIKDDIHIVDNVAGVEFHLYDDYVQMTREGEKPISISAFTDEEKATLMEIKNLITDPAVTQDKKDNYQKHMTESRMRFAKWFEEPQPIPDKSITEEEDTEDYVR